MLRQKVEKIERLDRQVGRSPVFQNSGKGTRVIPCGMGDYSAEFNGTR
ncbi:hypothetical protein H6F93_00935 [Leptolyngbya sp. FACHB-671]|nr:hypothetical protein [Leptolyngbya sp. FACHB-671]MBD2066110.1 hypothetical protein [Leptolyngbya sp. FACHB-671]